MCSEAHKRICECLSALFSIWDVASSEERLALCGNALLEQRDRLNTAVKKAESPLEDATRGFRKTRTPRGPISLFGESWQSAHELAWSISLQVAMATSRLTARTVDAACNVLEPYQLTTEGLVRLSEELNWEAEEANRLERENDEAYDYLVTLQQAAPMIGKSKRTLERYRTEDTDFPMPDVDGGGGKSNKWKWGRMRAYLETKSGKALPARHPADELHPDYGTVDGLSLS